MVAHFSILYFFDGCIVKYKEKNWRKRRNNNNEKIIGSLIDIDDYHLWIIF